MFIFSYLIIMFIYFTIFNNHNFVRVDIFTTFLQMRKLRLGRWLTCVQTHKIWFKFHCFSHLVLYECKLRATFGKYIKNVSNVFPLKRNEISWTMKSGRKWIIYSSGFILLLFSSSVSDTDYLCSHSHLVPLYLLVKALSTLDIRGTQKGWV